MGVSNLKKWIIDIRLLRQIDVPLVVVTLAIAIFGVMNIYSATRISSGTFYLRTQVIYILVAIVICYIILLIDYNLISNYSDVFYWIGIVLLLATELQGTVINGSNSWLKLGPLPAIQPTEFLKIALIIIIAKKVSTMDGSINEPRNLIKIIVYTMIPLILILKQPEMGLAVICIFIVSSILFISGLNLKIILGTIALGIVVCFIAWEVLLQPYQIARITSFLNPEAHQQSTGYQLINSKIGIGSGGFWGKGYLNSTQISGGYVPFAHTDFIFSVVGEEWGLIGTGTLLISYGILLYRILKISKMSKDILGKLVCVGTFASLTFSIYQNIAMTIGLTPISGITLPFMSAGGSSIISNFMALALVLNISMRKKKINF
ncbi:rod shape-determining protein RodA [Clostridium pasteurianum DSM 525 = ATCC 6013]|nr:rod shape-determining protein RodA [Clostridium pasteurianum DSM 525 = ATCC 6013]AOZ79747.1 rod shape-determining protein RodA [Clostridium pasteurianum]